MQKEQEQFEQFKLSMYLVPVLGFFLALWTLYWRQGSPKVQKVSRLSVTLTLCWLMSYSLLWTGAAQTSEFLTLRLLYLNSLLTSGYFLLCLSLMIRLWQGKSPRLPLFSPIAERFIGKRLS
ncbi:MAG: hypothetical protein GDA44_00735 [Prochloron sp. SP5CPC1]|nr:hypothetical protein [Candidatus Paraprochloron terpiosi SP5CPC1]